MTELLGMLGNHKIKFRKQIVTIDHTTTFISKYKGQFDLVWSLRSHFNR